MASKDTGTTSRRGLGVGGVIHPQKNHQGFTKNPTETRAKINELTGKDIKKPGETKESDMVNPNFGRGERKG